MGTGIAEDAIVSDPEILGGMPAYDLAASVRAETPRDRIVAAYRTIKKRYLDLAVSYAEANPLKLRSRKVPPVTNVTLMDSGYIRRQK